VGGLARNTAQAATVPKKAPIASPAQTPAASPEIGDFYHKNR